MPEGVPHPLPRKPSASGSLGADRDDGNKSGDLKGGDLKGGGDLDLKGGEIKGDADLKREAAREAVRMQELRQVESERESECVCVSCGSSSCWSLRPYITHMTAEAAPVHNISYIWQMKQQLLELALPWKNMEGSLVNANQVML